MLQLCPECGGQVSSTAPACPQCGFRPAKPPFSLWRAVSQPLPGGWALHSIIVIAAIVGFCWYFWARVFGRP